jgi:hypothetical protein
MTSSTALIFSAALLGLSVAASAGETRIDAFGRKVDIGAAFREEISATIAAKTGSPIWSPLAIKILELEGKALARAEGAGEIDLLCIEDYRKRYPEQSLEQYLAFIATPDAKRWKKACVLEHLSGPQVDPKLVDGLSATLEIGMMMPMLVQAVRKVRVEKGLPDAPELTPEMEAKVPAMAEKAFSMAGCLLREILKQKPITAIVTDPASLQPIAKELMQAGACGMSAGS